ncbi:NAD-dependent 15-hydroxyprostaglandin dehydrogenase [Tricharina praecox]|uniref:NAD-dependent 15-hydroxyprostaglandin dehydrogenase n=1 Tax=Tricharina praecox TaxID=43433 RepID=UPI00221F4523|nr:NAD-dependent 15-hydroxyprostaglandin dehydrogenase [Tricharina praecox]KAI5856440.1 NAD-dependent 15-hydroxyprostaglandin dehydrogenase [Tricharina praecox]
MLDVKNKTAIITGAGSGINLAFATLLLSHGCSVLIADLSLTAPAQALLSASHPHGARVLFKHCDVSSWADLSSLLPYCQTHLSSADIVVTGAGIFEPEWSSFFWGSESDSDSRYKTLDVNLVHPIKLTRLAISSFISSRKSRAVVLHISSISGQTPKLSAPIYTAAKHGINGFVRSFSRLEAEMGIRVVAVAPGVVRTPLFLDNPEKLQMIDEERDTWTTPEEVAEAMLMCVSTMDVRGGEILECGHGYTRKVDMFMDPGPPSKDGTRGCSLAKTHLLDDQAMQVLVREREAAEKAAAEGKAEV